MIIALATIESEPFFWPENRPYNTTNATVQKQRLERFQRMNEYWGTLIVTVITAAVLSPLSFKPNSDVVRVRGR